jgi:glycerol-3-phosphate dehydrogenase
MKQPDAIIIGGGIQGVSMALAAAQRGLHPVLVEKTGLAAGASGNSYGIVHGGLRYLQTLDIPRWRRSRLAQSWFLREFPSHVRPLRYVMPLYKGRLRSPKIFRIAMAFEQTLAAAFDAHVPLPTSQLLTADAVKNEFGVITAGLAGAACWHDAEVIDMPDLLRAMLKRAGLESPSLYMPFEARELLTRQDEVIGLRIADINNGDTRDIMSRVVINCAGAWAGSWQQTGHCPTARTLAFNLLLTGKLPGNSALAVSPIPGKGRSYFIRPHPEGIFAGTYYRPAPDATEPIVTATDIQAFLDELNAALPNMELHPAAVKEVMAGLLPDKDGSGRQLSSADHILTHHPHGFYSIVGGKFTTAPLLSEDAANQIWPHLNRADHMAPTLVKHHG